MPLRFTLLDPPRNKFAYRQGASAKSSEVAAVLGGLRIYLAPPPAGGRLQRSPTIVGAC
jgi:hypothetical protein